MAAVSITTAFGSTPSYWTSLARSVVGSTWAGIRDGAGTGGGSQSAGPLLGTGSTAGRYTILYNWDFVFDMSDYLMLGITSATLSMAVKNSVTSTTLWATDAGNGIAICGQRETTRGTSIAVSNYQEVHAGAVAGTEYCTRVPWSSLPGAGGGTQVWTFNAAGLAYLNSVNSKTYNKGYCFLGGVWGGIVDGLTPTSDGVNRVQRVDPLTFGGTTQATLSLGYSTSAPKVGTALAGSTRTILGSQISISNTWRTIIGAQINIGDTWRTIV